MLLYSAFIVNNLIFKLEAALILFPLILISTVLWCLFLSGIIGSFPSLKNETFLWFGCASFALVGLILIAREVLSRAIDSVSFMGNPFVGISIHLAAFIYILSIIAILTPNIFPPLMNYTFSYIAVGTPALIPYIHLLITDKNYR